MRDETFVTEEGFEKLKNELLELKTVKRKEVANRIQAAKEFGDLSENAEYADAKDQQAFVEGRIVELEEMMNNITIIKEHQKGDGITIGNTIKIKDDKGDIREYEIVGRQEADPMGGKISNESPLGKAFLGRKIGEVVEVSLPAGIVRFEVVEIL